MSTNGKLPVIELFGPTIQGEGLLLGVPTHFLRLGGCSYRCTWCDSMHAVDPAQIAANRTLMSQMDIYNELTKLPRAPYVTLTGGDPCMHKDLNTFLSACFTGNYRVAVETQGEFFPNWLLNPAIDVITFSPKGPSSGMNTDISTFLLEVVKLRQQRCRAKICVKVVVFDPKDLDYAFRVYNALKPSVARPQYDHFTFQVGSPLTQEVRDELKHAYETAGVPEEERNYSNLGNLKRDLIMHRYEWLVDTILKSGIELDAHTTITPQQHTLLWPTQERGR